MGVDTVPNGNLTGLLAQEAGSVPPVVKALDTAIKWFLLAGMVLVCLGVLMLLIGTLAGTSIGPRLGLSWVTVRVVDVEAGQTVLTGSYPLQQPTDKRQTADLGSLLVPSGSVDNLRLVVTDYDWMIGSSKEFVQWNGAIEPPGIAPVIRAEDAKTAFQLELATVNNKTNAQLTVALPFVVKSVV
jgi:hypothetical protein